MSQNTHSARLHALSAALCALLLLVALGLMDAQHAPWWALLATQGALLAATASAGIWLDRAQGAGGRGQATERGDEAMRTTGLDDPLWWARLERDQQARQRRFRAGVDLPSDDDDVFWQERIGKPKEDKS